MFPDGTSQVWKLDKGIEYGAWNRYSYPFHPVVRWEFSYEGEFMHLAQLSMLLRSYGYFPKLHIKYLPYGRQDKHISNHTTFALTTFAMLLNTLGFQQITICDPHSLVALSLINNSHAVYSITELKEAIESTQTNMLCYPDSGAVNKYTYAYCIIELPYIYGEKEREQETGKIINYNLMGDPSGKNVLIVDDICDGGMTFKLLTAKLLTAGASKVNLFVTHGIFSKGLKTLYESGIERIFTQDGEVQ